MLMKNALLVFGALLFMQVCTLRCQLLEVNEDRFLPVGLIKLGSQKGWCMGLKTSMNYKVLCIRRAVACVDHFNPAKRSERSHVGSLGYLQRRSLRHIAPRSDVIRTVAPEIDCSPLSGLRFGPKARGACFYVMTAIVAIFLFLLMLVAHPFVLFFLIAIKEKLTILLLKCGPF